MINVTFRPKWWATLLTLLMLTLLLNLGFWQLRRADEKQQLVDNYVSQAEKLPLSVTDLPKDRQLRRYHPVKAEGFYDNKHNILLDNQTRQGKAGYHVLTPLVSNKGDTAILINRGWIPQGDTRQQLPAIKPIDARQMLAGMVYIPPKDSFVLDESLNQEPGWPKRIQVIDTTALAEQLGYNVQPFIIWLGAEQANGFVRDWQPRYLKPAKHLGYAVQWFALAAALFVIYIVVNCRRRKSETDAEKEKRCSS